MVDFRPLRGLLYAPRYLDAAVLAPPYDVIGPRQHRELLERSPHNVVRLILGLPEEGDDWHRRAARTLGGWVRGGVLVRDPSPRFYGYRQHYWLEDGRERARTGVIGRVRLVPWGEGIHRHEHTRMGPKADRLRLMRATATNLSPVFGLYRDSTGDVAGLLARTGAALLDGVVDGVREVLWAIDAPDAVRALEGALSARDVVIADGHHRYETAMAYRDERRLAEGDPPGRRPYDDALMYLAAVEDPGLAVLPTHRVVAGAEGFEPRRLLEALAGEFDVRPVVDGARLSDLVGANGHGGPVLGVCLPRLGRHVLRPRGPLPARAGSEAGVALSVSLLQERILAPHLGISPELLATGGHVSYTASEEEACALVTAGEAQAAFILSPTPAEEVWRAATAGTTLPQKSTYFYPKLLSGLVMNPLDSD